MDTQKTQFMVRVGLAIIILFFIYEVTVDISEGEGYTHSIFETLVFVFISYLLVRMLIESTNIKKELDHYKTQLEKQEETVNEKVSDQFNRWKLTAVEKEIAWLIIKGFSFVEIAHIRSIKEKTARQHASNIYAKSETSSRSDFTAQFIDDILNTTR